MTARSEDYQTDTVFASPQPGQRVFADINANGIFDPGGKDWRQGDLTHRDLRQVEGCSCTKHPGHCVTDGFTYS
ncbi:hypothetical protein [Aquiluna sp. KACHI24]|uniref:hypothetical protein n=1 Tax=Aquiluna sp. KACHI24 TaxID=2968831 RepID=UPI00223299E4|nr:hypothetical protein [Aquiluna sp. KACHI24]